MLAIGLVGMIVLFILVDIVLGIIREEFERQMALEGEELYRRLDE